MTPTATAADPDLNGSVPAPPAGDHALVGTESQFSLFAAETFQLTGSETTLGAVKVKTSGQFKVGDTVTLLVSAVCSAVTVDAEGKRSHKLEASELHRATFGKLEELLDGEEEGEETG
jgi:hypothetical protein